MSFEPKQMEMICLEDLVSSDHVYRKFQALWNLEKIRPELERLWDLPYVPLPPYPIS